MKKRIIQAVIFISGIFLFAVALTPRYLNDRPDSKGVDTPSVVKSGEEYLMYYTGYYLGGPGSIHLAVSKDGQNWEKYKGNPVLKKSFLGRSDSVSITNPVVVKDVEGFKCYYFGYDIKGDKNICLATSKTGYGWTKYSRNPVFVKSRALPESFDVQKWNNEQVEEYLRSLNFSPGPMEINRTLWLEQFLKIVQEGEKSDFIKSERVDAMILLAWTTDIIGMDFSQSDFGKVLERTREITQRVDNLPKWTEVRLLSEAEINTIIEKIGISSESFAINKREYITKMMQFLQGDMSTGEALRYLKAVEPVAFGKSRKDMPELRNIMKSRFTKGGFEGQGIVDFSIVYDGDKALYRMWYIGRNQYLGEPPMNLLGYAESTDGIEWKRQTGAYSKGAILDFRNVTSVSAMKCYDGILRVLVRGTPANGSNLPPADAYIFNTNDGLNLEFLNPVNIDERADGGDVRFDDGGMAKLSLGMLDGKYTIYYGGNLNEWDTPFPDRKEVEKLKVADLYKYSEMVGFRMSRWNRQYVVENLSIAKTILENPEGLSELSESKIRDLALYYMLEFDLKGADLNLIGRDHLIMAIRRSFLNRTFVKYGRTIEYPSLTDIRAMDSEALNATYLRYGLAILRDENSIRNDLINYGNEEESPENFPESGKIGQMSRDELLETARLFVVPVNKDISELSDDEMRRELETMSKFCEGRREHLDEYSQEQLIELITTYGLSVKLDASRDLPREVGNIPREHIENVLVSTLKDRRNNFLGQQRVVTRIGLAISDDLETWTVQKGDKVAGSIVTNDPRGIENPLVKAEGEFSTIITILGWFAVGLGLINLGRHHAVNIAKQGKNYMMSASFFIALFASVALMWIYYPFYSRFVPVPNPYKFMSNFITEPIVATILGLLGYYITSAAYRAFRVKNLEAAVMMTIAVLCMLGNIPLFEPISRKIFLHTAFDRLYFPYIREWLMGSANAAVFRGLNFGISIGVVAMSIRIILGLEKGAFFEKL